MELEILETGKKLKDGTELVDLFDTRGERNPYEWKLVAAKVRRPDAEYLVNAVKAAQSIVEAQVAPSYLEKFPLDTPGRFYDAIADRIRAGEGEDEVLADVGMCRLSDQQSRVAEAARRYVEATAGLENTEEGRALLAAVGKIESQSAIAPPTVML